MKTSVGHIMIYLPVPYVWKIKPEDSHSQEL
jgi:hypothetical protein